MADSKKKFNIKVRSKDIGCHRMYGVWDAHVENVLWFYGGILFEQMNQNLKLLRV
jgi:hypothetical protein